MKFLTPGFFFHHKNMLGPLINNLNWFWIIKSISQRFLNQSLFRLFRAYTEIFFDEREIIYSWSVLGPSTYCFLKGFPFKDSRHSVHFHLWGTVSIDGEWSCVFSNFACLLNTKNDANFLTDLYSVQFLGMEHQSVHRCRIWRMRLSPSAKCREGTRCIRRVQRRT